MAKRKLPLGSRIFIEHPTPSRTVYRVWLSAKFLGPGMAPERRGFASLDAARAWIDERWAELHPLQAEAVAAELSPLQIADAKAALAKLSGRASLVEAAFFWESQHAAGESKTVAEAIAALYADRLDAGLSRRHCLELKAKLARLLRGHEKKSLSALTAEELRITVDGKDAKGKAPSQSQRVKRLRYFSVLAEFSKKQGWLTRNPAEAITRPRVVRGRPEILTVPQCRALLLAAKKQRPDLLPALALKLFAGLRNDEMALAKWEDLKADTLRVQRTKTGRPRSVSVEPALLRWLPSKRPKTGPIFAARPAFKARVWAWLEELAKLENLAGAKIPQNALRHSYGTYLHQKLKDTARTAFEMGNSPAVVAASYADAVSDRDAAAFWALAPDSRD
ncbi:MAG: hypothetical protein IAE97_07505 [Chthoniobacterales bacterium]|nr:hypothetical protein [Chthoniobacterales bacterium]